MGVGGSAVHFDRPTKSNYTQAAMAQKNTSSLTNATLVE